MNTQKKLGFTLITISLVLIVLLSYLKSDMDSKNLFLCEAVAANPDLKMEDCPAHNNDTSWVLFVSFGLSILLLSSGIFLIFLQQKKTIEKKPEKKVMPNLDKEEQKIYDMLFENEGSLYQSILVKKTGYSKVKITRILDKMESSEILERKRRGMTNIVVLK